MKTYEYVIFGTTAFAARIKACLNSLLCNFYIQREK